MDERLRKLERLAASGDPDAARELQELRAKFRPRPKPRPLNSREIELDIGIDIGNEYYELDGMMAEVRYEVDGADEPPSYYDPGSRASWLVYEVALIDPDQIDAYNEEMQAEGYAPLPFVANENIIRHLTERQIDRIAAQVEDIDREPYYPEPDDDYGYPDYEY